MADHSGHRGRLKQEFLLRPDSFPDHKLLELLLFYANPRSDTNPLAHDLMDHFGTLAGVLDATPDALKAVPGIGEHAATLFKAVNELSRRYHAVRTDVSGVPQSSRDYFRLLHSYFSAPATSACVFWAWMGKIRSWASARWARET